MKRIFPLAAACLMLAGCGAQHAQQKHSRDVFAMDTYMLLTAYGNDSVNEPLIRAEEKITALEHMLSVTDAGSEIYAANHAGGAPVTVSDDTAAILRTAASVSQESGGALQISLYPVVQAWGFTTGSYRVPGEAEIAELLQNVDDTRISLEGNTLTVPDGMQIDLGALAKGYTGDAVTALLREAGITSAIVNLGGNVQTIGTKPDGSKWTVGIENPFGGDQLLGTVHVGNKAVITSGDYERFFTAEDGTRYWHIIDPADGAPADNGLRSVTVIGESGLRCDALSTALFVEGTEKAIAHWRACDDFEMILVTDDRLFVTEGIVDDFAAGSVLPWEEITR